MSGYLARAGASVFSAKTGKCVFAAALIVTLFLLSATLPLAMAKDDKSPWSDASREQWEGGHWAKIKEKLQELRTRIAEKLQANREVRVYQEWLGITRIEERIALSPATGAPAGAYYVANVYVINTRDGLVLVDCGVESMYSQLMEKISKRFNKKPIIGVMLTHGHADHAGAGHYFVEAGIPVYAPGYDAFLIQMGMNFPGVPADFTYTGYTPTGFIYGGETMFGLSVVPTPGHTYGSLSFVEDKKDALFCSDTTICYPSSTDPLDMTYTLEYMTMMSSDNTSLQMQLGSLNSLAALAASRQVDLICPGHGDAYRGRNVAPFIQNSIDVITQILGY